MRLFSLNLHLSRIHSQFNNLSCSICAFPTLSWWRVGFIFCLVFIIVSYSCPKHKIFVKSVFLKTFLWVHNSCSGGFIVTYLCMHTMYPSLVYPSSPLFSLPLLKMTSTGFNVPYSFIHRKYINHVNPPLPSSFPLSFCSTPT
jgi:hypothetical protein